MNCIRLLKGVVLLGLAMNLVSCAYSGASGSAGITARHYSANVPQSIDIRGERTVVVYPSQYAWGAYDRDGTLVRSGIATSGGDWCEDDGRPCRTSVGVFRVSSLGDEDCRSSIYPRPTGGGLMPYCMFFNGGQALHGSPDETVVAANISHGCVRMRIPDAEWMRNNFAHVGMKVIVKPYED